MSQVMEKTRASFFSRLKSVFSAEKGLEGEDLEDLEEILYTSDLGPQTVQRLMDAVEEHLSGADKKDLDKVVGSLKSEMSKIFSELEHLRVEPDNLEDAFSWPSEPGDLQVWLIVGVNGAGKTTTIGKLANVVAKKGLKAMVAAGDTFRAAAGEQLKAWSERAQVEIFSPENVTDPSAVAFDACSSAKAKGFDVVIIDTAGRLHTHKNLMEELKKMKRVVQKVVPEAPHEALVVLDANSGQNALIQAKEFNQAIELTGAVLTKLDGSAKGGVAVGLAFELGLPVRLIGVGEGIEDIQPFKSAEFVDSIL
ncbi:MAG: signal recognition particle-docking protein FtsY [Bdellovibrionales bacterium]|nr:signal recognition particle-docking protein FtsY [Bdellovibrionales bacterium]